ncbi:MAG: hypothetical protein KGR26_02320 [Cyanobacteria bacterium REEB65]|nr:hypothetical protein [Cyanobacteria bacterium REEB65]
MTKIDTLRTLKQAWTRMRGQLGFWLVATVLTFAFGAFGNVPKVHSPAFRPILSVAGYLLSTLFAVGFVHSSLLTARGERPAFAGLLGGWSRLPRFAAAGLFYGVVVTLGTLLLVVPGAIWSAQFLFAPHFVVDRKLGPYQAMVASSEITKGMRWEVLKFMTLSFLVLLAPLFVLVALAALALGLLVSVLSPAHIGNAHFLALSAAVPVLAGLGILAGVACVMVAIPLGAIASSLVYQDLCDRSGYFAAKPVPGSGLPGGYGSFSTARLP